MPITCKCGESHDAVPQAEFDKRVKVLTDQRTELKAQLAEVQGQYDSKEIEALRADRQALVALRGEVEARDVLGAAGFKADGKAIRLTRTLYEIATEGMKETERPSFAAWVADDKGAKAEPTLAPLRLTTESAKSGQGAPRPAAGAKPEQKARIPNTDKGATDPGNGRLTPAQFMDVMNRTPLAERAAKAKELGFEPSAAGRPGVSSSAADDGNSEGAAA